MNTARQMGGSLGLAVLATVATERTAHLAGHAPAHAALTSGFHRAFLLGGAFAAVGAFAGFVLLVARSSPRLRPRAAEA